RPDGWRRGSLPRCARPHSWEPWLEQRPLERGHVLVAAARETDEYRAAGMGSRPALGHGESVGALERRQDPLALTESAHAGKRLLIARGLVVNAPDGGKQRVLGTPPRIVEPCRDRMRLLDLAVLVLQQHRVGP